MQPNKAVHLPDGTTVMELVRRDGKNLSCFLDTKDYDTVKSYRWCAHKGVHNKTFYVMGNSGKVYLHRLLIPDATKVDHRDGDGLNNRRENLRAATHAQNLANARKHGKGSTSKYIGVGFDNWTGRFVASIGVNGKRIHLGRFDCESEAAYARDAAAHNHYGEFARLNFPTNSYPDLQAGMMQDSETT